MDMGNEVKQQLASAVLDWLNLLEFKEHYSRNTDSPD